MCPTAVWIQAPQGLFSLTFDVLVKESTDKYDGCRRQFYLYYIIIKLHFKNT